VFFAFSVVAAPATWNSIPVDIRASTPVPAFKTQFKHFYLRSIEEAFHLPGAVRSSAASCDIACMTLSLYLLDYIDHL